MLAVKYTEMTQAQWNALTTEQQQKSGFVKITDGDYSSPIIYRHCVEFTAELSAEKHISHCHITVYKAGNAAFTPQSFVQWIQDKGVMSCTGKTGNTAKYDTAVTALGKAATTTNNTIVLYADPENYFSRRVTSLTDTVTTL